ncbi:MAG: hypothetical protein IBJ03_17410 [Gemmatimonadaceae bacterium]|nr:hypothetical protein [Gemmatimonadaceae bacterium]
MADNGSHTLPARSVGRTLPTAGESVAAPPFLLPALHFFAALGWLTVAALLVVALAPALAQGRIFDPPVFVLVHALTLGVVTTAIFGTLQQFVPSGLGVPLRSIRLGFVGFWLLQTGIVLLILGFWWWRGVLQMLGWLCILAAVGAVSRNVLRVRRRSVHGKLVGLFISVAHSALGAGMFVALARIGETIGWWHVDRLFLIAAHAMLGTIGFGTLSAIGVGSRMLPTFLMGPGDDRVWLHWQLGLTSAALLLFSVGAIITNGLVMRFGGWLLLVAAIPTLGLLVRWFRRRRRTLDGALWHVAASAMALAVSTGIGLCLLVGDPWRFARWSALLVALLMGWLAALIVGVMAKILPHLSYINLARTMPGFSAIGTPNGLLREDWQRWSAFVMAIGCLTLVAALAFEHSAIARGAAILWAIGVLIAVANVVRMFVLGRRAPLSRMEPMPSGE